MDPEAYTRLIFDDDKLSRSRLYFWTLSCLNEFIASLEDTQKQWVLFRTARVDSIWKTEAGLETEAQDGIRQAKLSKVRKLLKEGENNWQSFEDTKAEFRAKVGVVQTLRDGVRHTLSFQMTVQHSSGLHRDGPCRRGEV